MTREKLLEHICPTKNIDLCCSGATKIDCIDCKNVMNTYLGEYDKHVIAQYEAEHGNLADTIREIHDNVANEMYCKAIDEFVKKICEKYTEEERKGNYKQYCGEIKQNIADIAEQLKAGVKNGDLYIEARLQAIKDIASASCTDIKDADNIASFCDEIYNAIPKLDKIISQLGDYGNEEIEYYRNTPYENCIRECVSKAIEIVKRGGKNE